MISNTEVREVNRATQIGDALMAGKFHEYLCERAMRAWHRTMRLHPSRVTCAPFIHRQKVYYVIDLCGPCLTCDDCHEVVYGMYIYSPHGDRLRYKALTEKSTRLIP